MANRMLLNVWLLYISVVITVMVISINYGSLDLILFYDQTFISLALVAIYFGTELYQFRQVVKVDNEIEKIRQVKKRIVEDDVVMFDQIPSGMLKEHVDNLVQLNKNKKGDLNQRLLLENLEESWSGKNYAGFMSEIIMRIGLLGTVIGLLMALWTWIDQTYSDSLGSLQHEQIKEIIVGIFTGISPAFLTTATGLILSIILLVSGRILHNGMTKAVNQITVLCETQIIPRLDNENTTVTNSNS